MNSRAYKLINKYPDLAAAMEMELNLIKNCKSCRESKIINYYVSQARKREQHLVKD